MDSDDRILDIVGALVAIGVIAGIAILVFFGGNTGPANPQPESPDANWTAQRLNATHVQIGHQGGDPVGADTLTATVADEDRSIEWSDTTVDQGDTGVVRAAEGQRVTLYWDGDPRVDRMELASWEP